MPDETISLSPSSIHSYRKCPYLHLSRNVLRLSRPREAGLDPLLKGEIAHVALERCAARPLADPREVFDEAFREMARELRLGLVEEADRRALRAAVVRAAQRLKGVQAETEQEVETLVGTTRFHGRADRIERYPEGALVRDFKTGSAELDELQLDAYVLCVPDALGAVYERLKKGDVKGYATAELAKRIEGKVEVITREQLAGRRDAMRKLVLEVAAARQEGRLAVKPRDPEECTRMKCDGYDLCRVARARFLAKAGRPGWQS
jgi:RecB family exonuclease